MRRAFADTFDFLALLDTREARHQQALDLSRDPELHLVTTEWVLAEFGDAYCHAQDRADFVAL
jgi:predicted nucleic acid-binding protein